jgi:hypothetical protein
MLAVVSPLAISSRRVTVSPTNEVRGRLRSWSDPALTSELAEIKLQSLLEAASVSVLAFQF